MTFIGTMEVSSLTDSVVLKGKQSTGTNVSWLHEGRAVEVWLDNEDLVVRPVKTNKELRVEWLNDVWLKVYGDKNAPVFKTIGTMTICSDGREIAVAKLAKSDKFNADVGRMVAYAKLRGISIPDYI